jgi:hypothetical protein
LAHRQVIESNKCHVPSCLQPSCAQSLHCTDRGNVVTTKNCSWRLW